MATVNQAALSRTDHLVSAFIFTLALLVFWFSPVHQVSDSDFSMLLSQSLLEHGGFKLDQYFSPRPPAVTHDDYVEVGTYQLELAQDHIYYFFPPGSSVLSLPYVALLRLFGIRAKDASGTYGEMRLQTSLAALLMAALALVFFYTSRLVLDIGWSSVISLGGVFGTQVWSTASRGLWTHTWELLLMGVVVFLLLLIETGRHKPGPAFLATLLAWTYFVRPTSSVAILAITVYQLLYFRRSFFCYGLTLAGWMACFVVYSWHNFGRLLPSYYAAGRLNFAVFWTALAGNLVSPSRGLLIFVPWVLFTGYLLVRYRRCGEFPRLLWLSLAIVSGNLLVVSAFPHWWGGVSYGPRLTTDLVPWLVLLTILAVRRRLLSRGQQERVFRPAWIELVFGASLLGFSLLIHGRGAMSMSTLRWNSYPQDDAGLEAKIWDWQQPQFLAGLIAVAPPNYYPPISFDRRIDLATTDSDKYLWQGWGRPETGYRWTDGDAQVVFALDAIADVGFRIKLAPLIVPGRINEQIVHLELNGKAIETVSLSKPDDVELSFVLPQAALQRQNVLTFRLPQATAPEALRLSIDQRRLGLTVEWMEFSATELKQ